MNKQVLTEQHTVEKFNQVTTSEYSNLWIENTLNNMYVIRSSNTIFELKDKMVGKSCICVGAGPSLDLNIHLLKDCKLAIIACETILSRLFDEDIKPDYVVVNDPTEKIHLHFIDVDTRDITLVTPYFVHPKVLRYFTGRKLFFAPIANVPLFKLCEYAIGNVEGLYSGSCVGHMLNYLANYMGFNNIINVGQDLSYPYIEKYKGKKKYADGCNIIDGAVGNIKNIDNNGNEVFTDLKMLSYKSVFENTTIPLCEGSHLINATEGGILELSEQMSLSEALDQYS